MFKAIAFAISVSLLISSCGDSDSTNDSTNTNSIIGTWSFIYPSNGCTESYTFNSNGTWTESALDEIQTGTYTFDETINTGERHALSIIITSDNGLSDCNGVSSDATGVSGTVYAEFPSNLILEWYLVLTGGTADLVLTKQ
jgi:hypothetical protein